MLCRPQFRGFADCLSNLECRTIFDRIRFSHLIRFWRGFWPPLPPALQLAAAMPSTAELGVAMLLPGFWTLLSRFWNVPFRDTAGGLGKA